MSEKRPQRVKVARIWEIVEGDHEGEFHIEPLTEDDLREVMYRIIQTASYILYQLSMTPPGGLPPVLADLDEPPQAGDDDEASPDSGEAHDPR